MKMLIRQLVPAAVVLALFTVVTGIAYPLAVTAFAQVAVPNKADGSLVRVNGKVVGSRLIGQTFSAPIYFHSRPSAAGTGYDGAASSGSNLGPTNPAFLSSVADRVTAYRADNDLSPQVQVPVDAVTASGSGLDPDISVANAMLQAPRVAKARNLPLAVVQRLVRKATSNRRLGVLGDPGVNVLLLNVALDKTTR